ncbi:MAG: response regulator [Gammaproteobacteria bacterium]|nr:response regulator [Gammaproteobacteria bacterium]
MNGLTERLRRFIGGLSIGGKLHVITLGTTLLIFVGTLLVYVTKEFEDMAGEERAQLNLIAGMLGRNITAAVAFRDQDGARELLDALAAKSTILRAELDLPDGSRFVRYERKASAGAKANPTLQLISVDLTQNGAPLGRLSLYADTGSLAQRQRELLLYAGGFLVLGIVATLVLGNRLQRIITRPIAALTSAMNAVTQTKNFDLRLTPSTEDEVGQLVRDFNTMLGELAERDAALARHRQDLELQVAERTEALSASNQELRMTVEALEASKNRAEAASRAKSQFLANMSHELRTPMNGVLGMIEILFTTPLSEPQRHYCNAIRHSGESLLGLISNILDLSKIEAGKLELGRELMRLGELVEDVGEIFALSLSQRGIELIVSVDARINRQYYGDPLRLRQILINLMGNAAKFTQAGSVSLRLGRVNGDAGDVQRLRFEVADTGIGEEARSRIFEAFTQADTSTTRQFGGTGLGLTISRDLIRLMGGELEVSSSPGRGSVFSFTITLEAGPLLELEPHERLRDLAVLIADPKPESRAALENTLRSWGIAARVLDPKAAEAETGCDIAILNAAPDGQGAELLEGLRRLEIRQGLVILRQHDDPAPALPVLDAPICILLKPVRRSALYNAVLKLVNGEVPMDLALSQSEAGAEGEDYPQFGAKVLLAEDTALNQEVAVTMLSQLGCTTQVANNGAEALRAMERSAFDLVLMDCQMPIMDGFAATRRLRELAAQEPMPLAGRLPPIIAVTAHAVAGDREACIAAGMDDYLAKPYRLSDMAEVISRWLPVQAAGPEASQAPEAETAPKPTAMTAAQALAYLDEGVLRDYQQVKKAKGAGLLQRMAKLYLNEAPDYLADMRAGLERGDAQAVWVAAHSLKSCSAAVGATALSRLCRDIEDQGRRGSLETLPQSWGKLTRQFDQAYAAVEWLAQHGVNPVEGMAAPRGIN